MHGKEGVERLSVPVNDIPAFPVIGHIENFLIAEKVMPYGNLAFHFGPHFTFSFQRKSRRFDLFCGLRPG